MKKVLSVLLSTILILQVFGLCLSVSADETEYTISNPYEDVDWSTWKGYKAQLHCHTNASDGFQTIGEALEDYYALDYDIVAITDHGTTNEGWDKAPQTVPIMREIKKERSGGAKNPIIPLTPQEYSDYKNGSAKRKAF